MPASLTVPFHVPSIGDEEIKEVIATLRSGWLTTGPRTHDFELEFARAVQSPYAVAVSSGTAGLHLTLAGLDINSGDEVVTTPMTFCATVNAIIQVGAKPVLADVRPDGNIDPDQLERRITQRTRAVIPVHLGGLPCDMDAIWSIARKHGLFVIEDAAHAAGAYYHSRPIGMTASGDRYASDAVVFSFYATKNMTTGEGGMITTASEALSNVTRLLSIHGINRDSWSRYGGAGNWFYEVLACGFKYNLTDIQSAIGIHQLRKLNDLVAARTRYAQLYNELFADVDEVETPPDDFQCRHAWHLYSLRLNLDKLSVNRDEFIARLKAANISASVHFIPIPMHPYFAQHTEVSHYPVPRAIQLYYRIVSLPLYPALTEEQVRYVAQTVTAVVHSARRHEVWAFSHKRS